MAEIESFPNHSRWGAPFQSTVNISKPVDSVDIQENNNSL